MAAPKGNQFWKCRSKHGRDVIFSKPEMLWQAACEYFEYQDGRQWTKIDYKGKDADKVEIPTSAPYTLKGFCIFLGVNEKYFCDLEKTKRDDKEYSEIITRIKDIIYLQKFEGATVGAYNHNIIARDLGLAEKKEVTGRLTLEDLVCGVEEDEDDTGG